MNQTAVYIGEPLERYHFGYIHPLEPNRLEAFCQLLVEVDLHRRVQLRDAPMADDNALTRFHSPAFLEQVRSLSADGTGFLEPPDTPAFPGCYEVAAAVVGAALEAVEDIVGGRIRSAFLPIGGLHHARRDAAAGYCIFNDCAVIIETLRSVHGIRRVLYVDIDAHHGDGVFYAYEDDPDIYIADIHEDGLLLYPGTGSAFERGTGAAEGSKLNLPLLPHANDARFERAWTEVEDFLAPLRPEFVILQVGADGLAGDPLAELAYSTATHRLATRALVRLAERVCDGRLIALGGGGYHLGNVAQAWTAVVDELVRSP